MSLNITEVKLDPPLDPSLPIIHMRACTALGLCIFAPVLRASSALDFAAAFAHFLAVANAPATVCRYMVKQACD